MPTVMPAELTVRPLRPGDVDAADAVMRQAFGTFVGLPQPSAFMGDASFVRPRSRLLEDGAWIAERDGDVVGSNFATRWGSFGFFGPLSVRPDLWDLGVGRRLMACVEAAFEAWGLDHAGLFTFPHSPKHLALYQRHGFWPHALTLVMARPLDAGAPAAEPLELLSQAGAERDARLAACRDVAERVHAGLDLTAEAVGTLALGLGDVVLVDGGFAVCQHGAGTEAGSGTVYVKFAAVAPGGGAARRFGRLLDACEALAARLGADAVVAGVSSARLEAYRALLARGYRVQIQGLGMHRDGEPLWSRRGCWVLDDWR